MHKPYVIGIDQGTTGTFVGMMNENGDFVAQAYKAHRQLLPRPGWVEHDPLELWQIVSELVEMVMQQARVQAGQIAGLGIANQGESVVMWDAETGNPLHNVIVWQDTRTQPFIENLRRDSRIAQEIRARTGLQLDSYFSASKIRWLLDHVPAAVEKLRQGRLRCGTLDTWFIWKFSGGQFYVTDPSTASRTLLYNIHTQQWDPVLLDCFGIPRELLPDVQPTTAYFGEICLPHLSSHGIPILASIVDQPAALFGHACLQAGQIKATYGTGCFINMNTRHRAVSSAHGLLTLLAWQRDDQTTYGLDGGIFTAGTSINWLHNTMGMITSPEVIDNLCSGIQENPVIWIPAQIGLGAPYWNRTLRGGWLGIGLDTQPAHLVYAVLEGIALRVVQIVRAMTSDSGLPVTQLRADGGLTHIQTLMQLQADLLGKPVDVLADTQATGRGVCYLVARQSGFWNTDDEVVRQVHIAKTFEPTWGDDRRESRLSIFDRAILALQTVDL